MTENTKSQVAITTKKEVVPVVVVDENIIASTPYNSYKIAIDVFNGTYGNYENERHINLLSAGYSEHQIDEIIDIVNNIK